MRVFIFGIGGTGSRVLRSLTMLLASGVKFNHQDLTIIPVIIDTDAHNGDTARTRDILRSYHTIRNTFVNKTTTSQNDTFFNTQIKSFNRMDDTSSEAADLDVQFNFQNQETTFANFINHSALSSANKDVMELLYNDSINEYPELYLDLTVGFKGNPNIGSVVFNGLTESQQFKNLESSFTSNDRIFIVSSIFGGTGASGFPTLVKLIRNSTNENLKRSVIGAITVMPYFNVDSDDKSAINSAIFDTKTKAALSFYADDKHINSVNALYYLADSNQSGTFPNVEGGKEQVNNSHLIELIASTAIVDFINKSDSELSVPQCFEFGAESGDNPFTIAQFSKDTKENCIRPLLRFAYAAKIATDFIPGMTSETFYNVKELDIAGELGVPNEYKKILQFFTEFRKWSAQEMSSSNNGRSFISFNFSDQTGLNTLVHGKTVKTGFLNSGLSLKAISRKLTKIEVSEPKDMPVPEKYLTTLYKTAQECLVELGQMP